MSGGKNGALLLMVFIACAAQADTEPMNLTFNGSIIADGCDIAVASQNQSVHIGDFSTAVFSGAGSVSPAKDFDINLENCVGKGSITFTGVPDSNDPALLALTDTTGEGNIAAGVAIEVLDVNSGSPVPMRLGQSSGKYTLQSGDNTLHFQLRYKATQATVTPGNANAVMYFDMLYQ